MGCLGLGLRSLKLSSERIRVWFGLVIGGSPVEGRKMSWAGLGCQNRTDFSGFNSFDSPGPSSVYA